MSRAARVGLLVGACLMLVAAWFAIRVVDRGPYDVNVTRAGIPDRAPAHRNERFLADIPEPNPVNDDDALTDLYGNAVTDAVAKYKLNSSGSLYELHSPRTELQRLGPPKG